MKIQFLKSNDHTEILHDAYIYFCEYYLDIARKEKIDFSKGGKLGPIYGQQWIEEVCEQNIHSEMLRLHLMLCDFNKPERVIQDELNNIDIIKNTYKSSRLTHPQIIDNRYWHLNMILDKIKNNSLGKNLLTEFSEGSCNIYSWDNNNNLAKIITNTIELYDPLDFFSEEKKYMPEKMLDAKSLHLINNLNIPLRTILVENHNEQYLVDNWFVQYQIRIKVSDDFEENRENSDHIAYEVLDIFGVSLDGNVLTFTIEEENLCDGFEINPLSKNTNELIEKKVIEQFEENLLQQYYDGDRLPELIAENGYSIKIIKAEFAWDTENLLK